MILFLKPYFEVKPWAGKELKNIYDCPDKTGEAWIVSGYKNKSSIVTNGVYKGQTLRHLWQNNPELFGEYPDKEFPLLIKLISSSEKLSVQVHPNDNYAIKKHNQLGKFECWYILPETKAKKVTLGINVKNAIELKDIIDKGILEEFLIEKTINPHDLVIVEPGRVHAIHEDSFVLEVQEASDLTYRIYDYNRLPKRKLHINDSLNVIDYNNDKNFIHSFTKKDDFNNNHFNFKKIFVKKREQYKNIGFQIFYVINGSGMVNEHTISKGDTFITTVGIKNLNFVGDLEIISVIPKPKEKERMKMRKTALITGIVSQDGYYLTELLLKKGYEVHGLVQSQSSLYNSSINVFADNEFFYSHIGDLTDTSNINRILENVKPDEIYHLASQSHIDLSFELPEYTAQVNALGTLRLLDAIKNSEIRTKLFNMSTCYLFSGDSYPQNENTNFDPSSPYAISKLYAYYAVKSYRENYNIFAVNGICYNQISPFSDRGSIAAKVIDTVKKIKEGKKTILLLGNLDAKREWGYAKDYAYAMWSLLQQKQPKDYIVSTGKAYTVREFTTMAYKHIGINIVWNGNGLEEVGIDEKTKEILVKVDSKFIRPNDAKVLVGDSSKLLEDTNFEFKYDLDDLINLMLEN